MPTAVRTTTQELGDSRVRVDVEVLGDTLERELQSAAAEIGRELRVPGFRKGKVPPQVVIQQVGREAVLDEAVRRGLPGWYEQAIADARVSTVGDPKVDLADLPRKGAPLAFTIEVGVRPRARLGAYKGVEAGRREPQADPDEVQAELERLRESLASLETVERSAADGDFVVVDFVGTVDGEPFEGGEARGYLLELGSGRLIEGFEEQLRGAAADEEREVRVTFPDDYANEELAGREAAFAVRVKEVKEKRLPELDDDLAGEAGYDSLAELRGEVESRITEVERQRVEQEFREAAVDAAVEGASVDVPSELVHAKAHEMWHLTERRMAQQGIDPSRYLQLTGKTEEELVEESEPEARRALERESVIAAVVEEEGIEVSDDELLEALRAAARSGGEGREPSDKALRRSLKRARSRGGDDALRDDIAMRKAVDLIVEHAKPIPIERARAREELWTPDKDDAEEPAGKLWTPGN
ncbi:MAG: trigger factor [Nocardioidaceae bacterium]